MTRQLGVAVIGALAVFAGILFYVSYGFYDIGADTPHWDITRKLIEVVRDRSIELRANRIEVPDLQDESLALKGAGQYATMCVNCHLAPEQPDSTIRPGLYPKPPNLTEQHIDPKRAFWVTKHGLKMSGMPAWGLGHDDAAIWSIVAFVTRLPGLSAEHYKDMVARAPPGRRDGVHEQGGREEAGKKGREARGRDEGRTEKRAQALIDNRWIAGKNTWRHTDGRPSVDTASQGPEGRDHFLRRRGN